MSSLETNWSQLVGEISPRLYRYFLGSFAAAQASDLVQETLIRCVHKHRGGEFDPSKGSSLAYALGIARFVRLEGLKAHARLSEVGEEELVSQVSQQPSPGQSDPVAHLRWAISRLKPVEQEIILLMIDAELKLEQIAELVDLPLGTVKSHVHRAKENLRHIMETSS